MNKAQKINSEEEVEGYLIYEFDQAIIVKKQKSSSIRKDGSGHWSIIAPAYEVKPETLQVQITSTGEWVNVDDTEVVRKVCECEYPLVRSGYCGNCERDLI